MRHPMRQPLPSPGFCVFNDFSVRNTQMDEMARYACLEYPSTNPPSCALTMFFDSDSRGGCSPPPHSGFGPQHSKAFANSISSTVVSADEVLPHIDHLSGRITVNDVVVREPKVDNWQFSLGQVSRFLIVGLPSAASKAKMAESLTFPASGLAAILFMLTSLYTRLSHTYQRARAYIQASFSAAAPFHWALASSE